MKKPTKITSGSASVNVPRRLDHVVLPVCDLETARARLSRLGFTVAPDARHPFGTENACVFLGDGTYLEPLAIAQRETCEAAAQKGNVFVARDQAFRFRNGADGFSALAFATQDAAADHAGFVETGFSAGRPLSFSRVFDDGKGSKSKAAFKLAFAGDLRSPDSFMFTCQRMGETPDRSRLQKHPNGVTGLASVVLCETNPSDFQYFLQEVSNQRETGSDSFGINLQTGPVKISVYNEDGMRSWFGLEPSTKERGLRIAGLVFKVRKLDKIRQVFDGSAVSHRALHNRLIVDRAQGQGAFFAFEESK